MNGGRLAQRDGEELLSWHLLQSLRRLHPKKKKAFDVRQ
jgi:hypothetical protein